MGNMKFDGADVTFELDGMTPWSSASAPRRSTADQPLRSSPGSTPSWMPSSRARRARRGIRRGAGGGVRRSRAHRLGRAHPRASGLLHPGVRRGLQDAACRFGFSKDGNNTFKSAVDAFAANICDLYGAAPQIVDGFCEFLARNACLEFDGYAADMPVPCQLYVAEGISKMAYQQAMNSVRGFKLDTDASVEFADKFINDNVTTPDSFIHLNDACIAIENVKAATSTPSVPEASVKFAVTQAAFEHKTVDHFDDALRPVYTDETDAEFEDAVDAAQGLDADATGIIARPDTDHPARPDEATSAPVQPETYRQDDYQDAYQERERDT